MEVWVEPGRWISTPAMHILLQVIDKKNRGTVITDGGISMLGWERPLSEFIPVVNLSRPSVREIRKNIFGSLCTPDDIWGFSVFAAGIETGDILLIPDQGAYTYSLRQSFIKPRSRVVRFDGRHLEEVEKIEKGDR
jgi:diaminopimelate decarboxylase